MITYNLQEYDTIFENKDKNYLKVLLILLLIGIIFIICRYKFYIYEKNILLNENNNYSLIVNALDIDNFKKKGNIYINNKEYKYKVISYNNDINNINNELYETINIDINYHTKAQAIECYFLKSKKTLLEMFINSIRGG